jgi:hypothetical protein
MVSEEQLALSKANVMLPLQKDYLEEYSQILIEICSQCLQNKNEIYDLSIIEYILFLTKLRIISIGPEIELEYEANKEENSQTQKVKITIDLNVFLKKIYEASTEALSENKLVYNDYEVILDWPNIRSEKYFLNLQKTSLNMDFVVESICEYVKEIKIQNQSILLKNFDHEQKVKLYENLPLILQNKIQDTILKSIKIMVEKDLFGLTKLNDFRFSLYNTNYQEFLRLFFSVNLRNIYQEYYVMASKKINPSYIDKLTLSERKIYISLIEEESKANENDVPEETLTNFNGSPELQKLMSDFGDV